MDITVTVSEKPPYISYKALNVRGFASPLYVRWDLEPESADAGVDPSIAHLLAESWSEYNVLFLRKASDRGVASGDWQKESDTTFSTRLSGNISGLCLTSDVATVQTLFDQPGFDWSQQGQFCLLFPITALAENLPAKIVATAIAKQNLDLLPDLAGYVRPGDDGDFLELGFQTDGQHEQWLLKLARLAHENKIAVRSDAS